MKGSSGSASGGAAACAWALTLLCEKVSAGIGSYLARLEAKHTENTTVYNRCRAQLVRLRSVDVLLSV